LSAAWSEGGGNARAQREAEGNDVMFRFMAFMLVFGSACFDGGGFISIIPQPESHHINLLATKSQLP
jgi:hypothetical protein